jgi:hypothetical protein
VFTALYLSRRHIAVNISSYSTHKHIVKAPSPQGDQHRESTTTAAEALRHHGWAVTGPVLHSQARDSRPGKAKQHITPASRQLGHPSTQQLLSSALLLVLQVQELQSRMSRFHGLTAANPERKTIAAAVTDGCESLKWQVGARKRWGSAGVAQPHPSNSTRNPRMQLTAHFRNLRHGKHTNITITSA